MHLSALSYLVLLAVGAKGVAAAPPKGYSAFFSTFNHAGCDIQSLGMTTVEESKVGDCVDLTYSALSVNLEEVQEGCWRKLILTLMYTVSLTKHSIFLSLRQLQRAALPSQ